MIKAGNRVVFDSEGSYIEDKVTLERMHMIEEGRMCMLKIWATPASGS